MSALYFFSFLWSRSWESSVGLAWSRRSARETSSLISVFLRESANLYIEI
jgi:hypothetical protein